MAKTINTFFSQIPKKYLEKFLIWTGICPDDLNGVDWNLSSKKRSQAIKSVIDDQDIHVVENIMCYFDQISEFDNYQGSRALDSIVSSIKTISSVCRKEYETLNDPRLKAIWLLLKYEKEFDYARSALFADKYYNGANWNGYAFKKLPENLSLSKHELKGEFESKIKSLFQEAFPHAKSDFDWFQRNIKDVEEGKTHLCSQITVYQESDPHITVEFSTKNQLKSVTRRPVHQGAIVYNEKERSLDVIVKGQKKLRNSIAEKFAETFVDINEQIEAIQSRNFDLSDLINDINFEIRADDVVSDAWVEKLTLLNNLCDGFSTSVNVGSLRARRESIHKVCEKYLLNNQKFNKENWKVWEAKIRIIFKPKGQKKEKQVTINLKMPNRSDLRDQSEEHRYIAHNLLERWGLYEL